MKKYKYAYLSSILTIILAIIIFGTAGRLPFGELTFGMGDLQDQYIPFIKSFWRAILSSEDVDYTFSLGLGIPSWPIYVCYVLSPFNVFFLIVKDSNLATIFVVFLKYAISAFCFQRFSANVLKRDNLFSSAVSILYALCGYSIAFYLNIIYADGVYMLPVILMALYELIQAKKCRKMVVTFSYMFIVCFYSGYMIGFFSLLCLVLYLILFAKKQERLPIFGRFILSGIIATAISSFALFPTVQYILSHTASDDYLSESVYRNVLELFGNMFIGQYLGLDEPIPMIYSGIVLLITLPFFYVNGNIGKKTKIYVGILLGFLLLCTYVKPVYLFIHMFNAPDSYNFRFSYFYSFLFCCMTIIYDKYQNGKITFKHVWELSIGWVLIYISVGIIEKSTVKEQFQNITLVNGLLSLILFSLYLTLLLKKKWGSILFLLLVVFEVAVNGSIMTSQFRVDISENQTAYEQYANDISTKVNAIDKKERETYRIVSRETLLINEAANSDYMGIAYFNTVEQPKVREMLLEMGLRATNREVLNKGMTDFSSMILGVRYYLDYEMNQNHGEAILTETPYCLPLAYAVNDIPDELQEGDVFENQNRIARAFTGNLLNVFELSNQLNCEYDGVEYTDGKIMLSSGYSAGAIIFSSTDTHENLYYYLPDTTIQNNKKSPIIANEDGEGGVHEIGILNAPHIIDMTEKNYLYIIMNPKTVTSIDFDGIYSYHMNGKCVGTVYDELVNNAARNFNRKGSAISFDITIPENKQILFTSIPYDQGWKMTANGERVQIDAVLNESFCATKLEPGEYHIEMYYDSIYNWIGIAISIVGLVCLGILIYFEKRHPFQYNDEVQMNQE